MSSSAAQTLQLYMFFLLMLLLIATSALTVKQMNELKRLQGRRRPKLFTVVEDCDGKVTTREYKDGEYVGLVLERCPNGGLKRVIGVYALKEEKKGRASPI